MTFELIAMVDRQLLEEDLFNWDTINLMEEKNRILREVRGGRQPCLFLNSRSLGIQGLLLSCHWMKQVAIQGDFEKDLYTIRQDDGKRVPIPRTLPFEKDGGFQQGSLS